MPEPTWMTAFLDLPAPGFEAGAAFWAAATGTRLSPPRGEHGEFATLLPSAGDAHLRVQRLEDGPPGVHLDLHAPDLVALADRLVGLGATEVARLDDVVVLRSPGGLPLCAVGGSESVLSPPVSWGSHHHSRTDQVCVDIPSAVLDVERRFWAAAVGTGLLPPGRSPEFVDVRRPEHLPLRLLLQEVGGDGPVTAHLDLACDDREAEVRRLVGLGARVEGPGRGWTVLVDPAGQRFCVTDRWPLGLPPAAPR